MEGTSNSTTAAGGSNETDVPYDPKTDPKRKAKSNDKGWRYGHWPDLADKNRVKCNLCDKVVCGGIKRLKEHLVGGYGDATKCSKTTTEIARSMHLALMENKRNKPSNLEGDDDDSDNETEQEVEETGSGSHEVPRTKSKATTQSSGTAAKRRKGFQFQQPKPKKSGPMDAHVRKTPWQVVDEQRARGKGRKQTTIDDCVRPKEVKEMTDKCVAQWFYDKGIPFNAAQGRSYEVMLEAIGQHGPGYRGATPHQLRLPLLRQEKEQATSVRAKYEAYWRKYGCTLMSDGWTDRRGRHLINFLVNCPEGTYFMGSVDASSEIQDAKLMFELLDKKIEEIGAEYVVQVVTDNASTYKAAGKMLIEKMPTLFCTPCAAHCIDLMLEDIDNMKRNKSIIRKGKGITTFIYKHTRLLDGVRTFIGGDLVKHGITRFATSFLTLQSLLKHKLKLKEFFSKPEWNATKLARTEAGKQVVETLVSTQFWNGVEDCLKSGKPLMVVLRLVDADERPAMPEVYVAMEKAKTAIKKHFDNKVRLYKKTIEIVEKRWEEQMEQKLYGAALFLNPNKYFDYAEKNSSDAWKLQEAFHEVVAKMVPVQNLQHKIGEEAITLYKASRGTFGTPHALAQRSRVNPIDWWGSYGGPCMELTKIAIRILGLCCSSSGCERNWSTFEFLHTKRRNRLEHQRLSDLVYIQYNQHLVERFQQRREKNRNFNPLVLEDLDWSSEWMMAEPEDDLVYPDSDLRWRDVDRALGTGGRNLRSRNTSGATDSTSNNNNNNLSDDDVQEIEEEDNIQNDDDNVEDDYGVSPTNTPTCHTSPTRMHLLDETESESESESESD